MSKPLIEAFPLYWPEGWKRTEYWRRHNADHFKEGIAANHRSLSRQIDLLGGGGVIISSNLPVRRDGLPYADATAGDDPGVAVYFTYKKKPMCFACDRYKRVSQKRLSLTSATRLENIQASMPATAARPVKRTAARPLQRAKNSSQLIGDSSFWLVVVCGGLVLTSALVVVILMGRRK